jgi:carbamate kinase
MRLVVAIGGNALLRRGQMLSAANQLENIRIAATQLVRVAARHELVGGLAAAARRRTDGGARR